MLSRFRAWLHRRTQPTQDRTRTESRADKYEESGFEKILERQRESAREQIQAFVRSVNEAQRRVRAVTEKDGAPSTAVAGRAMDAMEPSRGAMDNSDTGLPVFKSLLGEAGHAQLALMPWFMQQGFIGYQNAAFIAQHWLVQKACATPVDDAIRNGYDITTADGDDLDDEALKLLKTADLTHGIMGQLRDFGVKGRIFGVRIAMFLVDSQDPDYYEKPFNIDGVKPGSYRGISQVDPYWTAPILDAESSGDPTSPHFYEPTWWIIGSKRVHRTHLVVFRFADPPDVIKPLYLFGGIPLPQMLMQRVYCAERTANEAPALALSKRTNVWLTNMDKIMANPAKAEAMIQWWMAVRDNFGIKLGDKEGDEMQQFDTPLADFDNLTLTQYGLVAAIAGCPITKLLGTTPGGFAATGDYDEASYHELLESNQERDLTPFLSRHHALVMRSEVVPKFPDLKNTRIVVKWHEVDAITTKERSQDNLLKAQTGAALVASGAIGPDVERARVAADKESGYHGIGIDLETDPLPPEDDPEEAAEASRGGGHAVVAAVQAEETHT